MPSSRSRDSWIKALLPGEEATLDFIPMAGRRALDRAGKRLSLAQWRAMPEQARVDLIARGAADAVDTRAVQTLLQGVDDLEPSPDLPASEVPSPLAGRIDEAAWAALGPVARHALESYARRGREQRLVGLLAALRPPEPA